MSQNIEEKNQVKISGRTPNVYRQVGRETEAHNTTVHYSVMKGINN